MPNIQFSLIICTYQRPKAILVLLESVLKQTLLPDEIIIVDGSVDDATESSISPMLASLPIVYTRVLPDQRGLTRQRNVGVGMTDSSSEVLVFLDDDVVLEPDFLQQLLYTFDDPEIIGSDSLIVNECYWKPIQGKVPWLSIVIDGYYLPLSLRDKVRKILGLYPIDLQPGLIPLYGHGNSSLPPTGKSYAVEHIMGGITAYRKKIFDYISFSTYFEGYGLYEDFDFSVRAREFGKLVTNTAARLEHHHEAAGRPNTYKYGKMVVRNGYYVWRLKHPKPGALNIVKWHCITLLLAFLRLLNSITLHKQTRREAWGDFAGRMVAWGKLVLSKS